MDPRLKLQYYEDNGWKEKYIKEAKNVVTEIWENIYKNQFDTSQSSDSVEDELLSHIFKKWRTERDDELKSYLREQVISKSTNILAWWKVNFYNYYILKQYINYILLILSVI